MPNFVSFLGAGLFDDQEIWINADEVLRVIEGSTKDGKPVCYLQIRGEEKAYVVSGFAKDVAKKLSGYK